MITTLFSRLLFLICILGGCDSMHMCPNGNCYVEEDKCDGFKDCGDSTEDADEVCHGHTSRHFLTFVFFQSSIVP